MTRLIALRTHEYDGHSLSEGDVYEASPAHADALIAAQASRLYDSKDMKAAESEPEEEPSKTGSRDKYKRRDMRAEK